ncbi:MAG TPA: zf-HC2 domain-containing protein [Terracidiphilus sp.]|jgi:anti-sigma factor RsiW
MNCEIAQERIVTSAYGELPDEQAHELAQHVESCAGCRLEREQVQALKRLVSVYPALEPSPNLVARARMRLEEALDALPPKRWYEHWGQGIVNNFARLQAAPVAALLLLVAGAGAGCLGEYEYAQSRAARAAATQTVAVAAVKGEAAAPVPELANVASISRIVREPNGENVSVSYNQLVPRKIEGSLDDPVIRQLLMLATENSTSPGIRDDSVGLLAAECRAGHSCQPSGIRDALMVALRYDRSAAVREKALQGLEPYVAEDVRVRDAVLEALLNDGDARVRSTAISLLTPVEADSSVRQVLYSVSNSDQSPQIRDVSRQVLSQVPEIQ